MLIIRNLFTVGIRGLLLDFFSIFLIVFFLRIPRRVKFYLKRSNPCLFIRELRIIKVVKRVTKLYD